MIKLLTRLIEIVLTKVTVGIFEGVHREGDADEQREDLLRRPGGVLHQLGCIGYCVHYHVDRVPQADTRVQSIKVHIMLLKKQQFETSA